ncbi:hypothetical protein [Streptomyces sp. NPDC088812]|uniref:hypothetical protein n=1 Tax=Streptomyces sp. NPDC088812 TaxID=3365905 RepID=UPI00380D6457
MHDLIRRALEGLRLLFAPGTGERRRARGRSAPRPHLPAVAASAPQTPSLPRHRSPYGLVTRLDGADSALMRPFLAADLGIGLDRHVIGVREVAA